MNAIILGVQKTSNFRPENLVPSADPEQQIELPIPDQPTEDEKPHYMTDMYIYYIDYKYKTNQVNIGESGDITSISSSNHSNLQSLNVQRLGLISVRILPALLFSFQFFCKLLPKSGLRGVWNNLVPRGSKGCGIYFKSPRAKFNKRNLHHPYKNHAFKNPQVSWGTMILVVRVARFPAENVTELGNLSRWRRMFERTAVPGCTTKHLDFDQFSTWVDLTFSLRNSAGMLFVF